MDGHTAQAVVLLIKSTFLKEYIFLDCAERWRQTLFEQVACAISITQLNPLVIIKHIGLLIKGITEVQGYNFNVKRMKCET